jgi:2'-5' RNA ligase
VREQLAAWARTALRGMNRRSGVTPPRVLDAELLHVTLCFLGNRPVGAIERLNIQLAACSGPAGELSLGAPLWLPSRRPRALAVELHDDSGCVASTQAAVASAMGELEAQLSPATVPAGAGTGDRHVRPRHFRPHITVARMTPHAAPRERALPATPQLSFVPRELVLYRSWLSPNGASYEALAAHPIG